LVYTTQRMPSRWPALAVCALTSARPPQPTKLEKEKFRPVYQVYNDVKRRLSAPPDAQQQAQPPAGSGVISVTPARPVSDPNSSNEHLARLRKEKHQLQLKLNLFERGFRKQHGRKIMWEADIASVKAEYERYKVSAPFRERPSARAPWAQRPSPCPCAAVFARSLRGAAQQIKQEIDALSARTKALST
jgi:hypothetical protein